MPTTSLAEKKKEIASARIASLMNQYEALNEQYDGSLDAGQKVILEEKIKKVEDEIKTQEAKLEERDGVDLNSKLHYIDFKGVLKQFDELLRCFGREGGISMMVLQNSTNMAGDLLMLRLQEELKKEASSYNHMPVAFSGGSELTELGLLKKLAAHTGIGTSCDCVEDLLDDVVDKICGSLQTRSVVFVEIGQWHRLPEQEKAFTWLCDHFYKQLSIKLEKAIAANSFRRVYVFLVVLSADFIPDDCLQKMMPFSIDTTDTQSQRIFDISLKNWSEEDIEIWLEYSGLPDQKLEATANQLYKRSQNGIPLMVRTALEQDFF